MNSGLGENIGMTYGTFWGDFDNDGLPDLYVTNHLHEAKLYRNLGKGRFTELSHNYFNVEDLRGDKHGAQWADYDNDGDLDLVQLTGAGRGVKDEPKRLFRNQGAGFEDVATQVGVTNPGGRTRMPLWVDLNGDGTLDLFHGAESRFDDRETPFTFVQQEGKFLEISTILEFATRSVPFCILTELNNDAHPEVVCRVSGKGAKRTAQIFDTSSLPARELDLLPATAFEDVAAADFDNDGLIDLFLARKNPPGQIAFGRAGSNELMSDITIDQSNVDTEAGFRFRSAGHLKFHVLSAWPHDALAAERIFIGNTGRHPKGMIFSLSKEAAHVGGLVSYKPGTKSGLYISLAAPDIWEVRASAPREALMNGKTKNQNIQVRVVSSEIITEHEALGKPVNAEEAPARLFMNRGDKLVEESEKRGVNERLVGATNVAAGDFDNDMDVDLFVLASGSVGKQENLLLLNQGDGHFAVYPTAGGAAGARSGVGDSATSVDFDGDGALDLLVATGGSMGRSLGLPSDLGGYRLYRNVGNNNHWIQIDLEGTVSNRDGIGAHVEVFSGGVKQIRVQDGGVHHRSQNHSRLHFGLGVHAHIDYIKIRWPSGTVQKLTAVASNQVLQLKEPLGEEKPAAGVNL